MTNYKEENMNIRLTEDKKKELIKDIISKASKAGRGIEEKIGEEANKIVCIIKDSVSTWNEAKQLIQEVECHLKWSTACGGEDLAIISRANEIIEREIVNIINHIILRIVNKVGNSTVITTKDGITIKCDGETSNMKESKVE